MNMQIRLAICACAKLIWRCVIKQKLNNILSSTMALVKNRMNVPKIMIFHFSSHRCKDVNLHDHAQIITITMYQKAWVETDRFIVHFTIKC